MKPTQKTKWAFPQPFWVLRAVLAFVLCCSGLVVPVIYAADVAHDTDLAASEATGEQTDAALPDEATKDAVSDEAKDAVPDDPAQGGAAGEAAQGDETGESSAPAPSPDEQTNGATPDETATGAQTDKTDPEPTKGTEADSAFPKAGVSAGDGPDSHLPDSHSPEADAAKGSAPASPQSLGGRGQDAELSPLSEDVDGGLSPAESGNETIDLEAETPPESGEGWSYDSESGIYTIDGSAAVTVTGTTTTRRVVVQVPNNGTAQVTLGGASITAGFPQGCALEVSGGTLALTLTGENVLSSGQDRAGLQLSSGANLIVTAASVGTLTATATTAGSPWSGAPPLSCAAGIGSGNGGSAGNIIISGGTVEATGGTNGAGIGSGNEGSAGTITISGGAVEATGGVRGAGIGSGQNASAGNITINGGTVTASATANVANVGGAGIGSGCDALAGNITINGGTVTATGAESAGIGFGLLNAQYDASSISMSITITGGMVTARSNASGAGIGGGNYGAGGDAWVAVACHIKITGGTVIATGVTDGLETQDIGNGLGNRTRVASVVIDGGSVYATRGKVGYGNPDGSNNLTAPTNSAGKTVYVNTLTFNPALVAGTAIVSGKIDGVAAANTPNATTGVYGIRDVKTVVHNADTENDTAVMLWLPNTEPDPANGSVSLRANGKPYALTYDRSSERTQTLVFNSSLVTAGDFTLFRDDGTELEDTDYSYDAGNHTLTIMTSAELTIGMADTAGDGTTTTDKIAVASGIGSAANITLNDVKIALSASGSGSAFNIPSGATAHLTLVGENRLQSGPAGAYPDAGAAGLHVPYDAKLLITAESSGSLRARGSGVSAGIGGNGGWGSAESSGDITINGGTIEAYGSSADASGGNAIGGGYSGGGGSILINGGRVTADGGGGKGIGTGGNGSGGTLTVTGGEVFVGAGSTKNGIGVSTLIISGGVITTSGSDYNRNISVGTLILEGDGVVYAKTINDNADKVLTRGILIGDTSGMVYGSVTPTESFSVPANVTLTVPATPAALTVADGRSLTIEKNGTLSVAGALTVEVGAALINHGEIVVDKATVALDIKVALSGNKIAGAAVTSAPTPGTTTKNSLTMTAVSLETFGTQTKQSVEYALSTTTVAPVYGWQTAITFTDIPSNTTYYLFARAAANANFAAGAALGSVATATTGPPETITNTVIGGVTAPQLWGAPVSAITATEQYTGKVTWSPPAAPFFGYGTVYTATITLTPKNGYTLTGVSANFFTVEGAAATNAADSGIVTAVFPETVADKSALTAAISNAKGLTRTNETDESWNALQAQITAGEAVSANTSATQAQVDAATVAIETAIANLRYNYTVTFDVDGGSAVDPRTIVGGSPVGELPESTKEGYTLIGWYTTAEGGTQITSETIITADVIYYAHWAVTRTVTFQDGTDTVATYYRGEDTAIGELPTATKTGYTLVGWFTAAEGGTQIGVETVVTADVTYYAHWTIETYTVTFKDGSDTVDTYDDREYNTAIGALPTATKPGHTLAGWFTAAEGGTQISAETTVTADVTYYAHWTINTYTVVFKDGESTIATYANRDYNTAIGELPAPTKTGYTLVGWYTEALGGIQVTAATPVIADATYYARWTINQIVTLSTIEGVTAPVTGAQPVPTEGGDITATDEYTGTVSWSPEFASDDSFAPDTVYTATITLTAKEGYIFEGVSANFFTVAGASATNAANTGIITATFPATTALPPPPPDRSALEASLDVAKATKYTFQTEASWAALQAAIAVGESIAAGPGATQAQIDAAAAAINTALAAIRYDYPILDAFVSWQGTGEAKTRINADEQKFRYLALDGHLVPEAAYTITSGSTIITLHESYLKALAPGSYDFYAEFTDGTAGPLTLTVKDSSGGGDDSGGDDDGGGNDKGNKGDNNSNANNNASADSKAGSTATSSLSATGDRSVPIATLVAVILIAGVILLIRAALIRASRPRPRPTRFRDSTR